MKIKRLVFFFPAMMILMFVIIGCNKKSDNSTPDERKKYAWIAGQMDSTGYGIILFSADIGETWVRQGQGTSALKDIDVSDIWAVDENNVWAVCSANVILKTIDGGQTWTRVPAPVNKTSTRLSAISIVNKTNIWISGSGGTVYNSKDNGTTWAVFDSAFFHYGLMQGIWALSPHKVYVIGGVAKGRNMEGFISFTMDGGATWDTVVPADDYNRNEWIGVTASGNTIVVYGGKSHYMVSTDGGGSWKNDSVPAGGGGGGADINHLVMLNSQIWWGAFDMDHVYLSLDEGKIWTYQQTHQSGDFLMGIDAWDSQLAITVGETVSAVKRGPILKTSDGGVNWVTIKICRSNLYKVTFIKK